MERSEDVKIEKRRTSWGARCYRKIKRETQVGAAGDKWTDSEEAALFVRCCGCRSTHGDKGSHHYTTCCFFLSFSSSYFVSSPHTLRL